MGILDIILIGIGLAMDCFAVSICYGFLSKKLRWKLVLRMALFFGGFQALMPVVGWLLGLTMKDFISQIDHWIAFGLLGFIGLKMIVEAIRKKEGAPCIQFDRIMVLLGLALATSIDALIVGLSFAFLHTKIILATTIIGFTSFVFTLAGIYLGKRYGAVLGKRAEIAGGIVLIGIGIKILIEHLFFQ
jgi:manganese efflux pump family protein